MKTFAFSFLLLILTVGLSNAQNVEIPDTRFLYSLIEKGVDTNGDSLISYAEAEAVIIMDVRGLGTEGNEMWEGNPLDMTGIEAFVNLDTLRCNYNALTSLDVSNNIALTYLDFRNNSLETLDVSNCTALTYLDFRNNSLGTLDVSNCTALTYLDCRNNSLYILDVSNCTALTYLDCSYNNLYTLDLSNCTALTYLDCRN
ncbi:leucine-rich repeat domain-containing protein, partial [Bacteroidota bacterium]